MKRPVGCSSRILETDGEMFTVQFNLKNWSHGSIYYLSGDFNSFGTGSLLFNEGKCNVRLLWGKYRFIVRENQYEVVFRGRLELAQEGREYHNPELRLYRDVFDGTTYIRLRTGAGATRAFLLAGGESVRMRRLCHCKSSLYFQAALAYPLNGRYSFSVFYGRRRREFGSFDATHFEQVRPSWVSSSVFYEVFPDRFSKGVTTGWHSRSNADWDEKPGRGKLFGGNLKGIAARLGHIKSTGADVLYSTPVFMAATEHRYDTSDYLHVDSLLGTDEDFSSLLNEIHSIGLRFVGDAVFNHSGVLFDKFSAFLRGENSWFIPHGRPELYEGVYDMKHPSGNRPRYETWEGVGMLPKFNLGERDVREYLLRVISRWTAAGVDGWRFDVGDSLPLDFVNEIGLRLRRQKRDAFLLGEVWGDPSLWLIDQLYDGSMNYVFRAAIIDFSLGKISGRQLANTLARFCSRLPPSALLCEYNLLGSHDTPRIYSILGGRKRVEFAYAILFSLPGAPSIYYGDEFMMKGANSDSARGSVDWKSSPVLRDLLHELSFLRRENKQLTHGDASFQGWNDTFSVTRTLPEMRLHFECARKAMSRELEKGERILLSGGTVYGGGILRFKSFGWCYSISRS